MRLGEREKDPLRVNTFRLNNPASEGRKILSSREELRCHFKSTTPVDIALHSTCLVTNSFAFGNRTFSVLFA